MSEDSQGISCTNAEKSLKLHDYIGLSEVSSHSNPPVSMPYHPNLNLGEAELRLGLSLTTSEWALGDNSGSEANFETDYARALQNQAQAMDDGIKCRYGLAMATGSKRGFNEAFGNRGEKQVSLGLLKLQMCGPSHPSGMAEQQYSSKPPQHSSLADEQSGVADASSTSPKSSVVGWPPIRSYRKNTLAAQPMSLEDGEEEEQWEGVVEAPASFVHSQGNSNSLFVKVNMEGVPIGRKIDLNTHNDYTSLSSALENMFRGPPNFQENGFFVQSKRSWLGKDCSDYLLTYEDKEGDWMLVGDVPWSMFVSTVKRLRIVKTSEGNGSGPKCSEKMNCTEKMNCRKTKAA